MAKMFVHIAKKATFTSELQTQYTNSIVFIKDTLEIWTHGQYYAIPDSYKTKITNLETAVAALQAIKSFGVVSDGKLTASAPGAGSTLTFKGAGAATVSVDKDGVTIDAPINTLVTGNTNGSVSFNGTDVAVKGLGSAAYADKAAIDKAIAAAKTAADSNINAVAGSGAITAAVDAENAQKVNIGLTLDTTGNVSLTQSTKGLKASVVIPVATVTGVADNDKVLSLTDKKVSATIAFSVDSTADAQGKKYLRLTGKDGADLGKVDIADFVKDGMLDSASYNEANHKLTLTFNSASGKDAIEVDLSTLVDVYDGSNLKVKELPTVTSYTAPKNGDNIDTVIANLVKKDSDLYANFSDVAQRAGMLEAATVNGKKVSESPTLDGTDLLVGGKGVNKAKTVAAAIEAINTSIESKNVSAEGGTYVTATASGNKVTVKDKIQAVSSASSSAKGLAEASDVKSYVDNAFAWEEL